MKKLLMLLLPVVFMCAGIKAQDLKLYQSKSFIFKGDTLPYRILYPENFDPAKKYPLLLVLHGVGERGNNNTAQLAHGGNVFIKPEVRGRFPAIVVFPQCPVNSYWANVDITTDPATHKRTFNFQKGGKPTKAMILLLSLVNQLRHQPEVNKAQFYVGGLSMGGMGTLEILRRKPQYFAAAFSICGGDNPANAKKYARKVPLWFFHGGKDDVVTPDHSVTMVAAVKEAGGNPKFTLYPNDNHNSWDDAFAEPGLLPWLFSHKK